MISTLKLESDDLKELIKARIAFNIELLAHPIEKDAEGNRGPYLSLEGLQNGTNVLMNPLGLYIDQTTDSENGKEYLITTLHHTSGQFKRSVGYLFREEENMTGELAKTCGGIMTYKQRYQWRSILGIGRGSEDIEDIDTSEETDYKCVSDVQAKDIYFLIKDHKDIQAEVFKHYNIGHTTKLPADKYEEAKKCIIAKVAAKTKKV